MKIIADWRVQLLQEEKTGCVSMRIVGEDGKPMPNDWQVPMKELAQLTALFMGLLAQNSTIGYEASLDYLRDQAMKVRSIPIPEGKR